MNGAAPLMSAPEHAPISWHISSFSADGGGNCVEAGPVNDGTGRVAVRHSKDPDGPVIHYTRTEWDAFVSGVRAGEFDFGPGPV